MYQQWIGIGNAGKGGAEMRYTPSGKAVATFSFAINKSWTKDGVKQDKTTWVRVTCWEKLAEIVAKYVTQGKQVMVIGEVEEARAYTDKDGNNRASLEVTAREVKLMGGGANGEVTAVPVGGTVAEDTSIPF